MAGAGCEEGLGSAATPSTGSTFPSTGSHRGTEFLPGVPKAPESQGVSRQEQGRKRGFAKSVFCRCPGDGRRGGDPSHTRSPHGRKEWFLFNCGIYRIFHTPEQAGNQAGPDQNVPEQSCWHSPSQALPLVKKQYFWRIGHTGEFSSCLLAGNAGSICDQ